MQSFSPADRQRALATMIAESLTLADALGLGLVSLSLNGALADLTGHGLPPMAEKTAGH